MHLAAMSDGNEIVSASSAETRSSGVARRVRCARRMKVEVFDEHGEPCAARRGVVCTMPFRRCPSLRKDRRPVSITRRTSTLSRVWTHGITGVTEMTGRHFGRPAAVLILARAHRNVRRCNAGGAAAGRLRASSSGSSERRQRSCVRQVARRVVARRPGSAESLSRPPQPRRATCPPGL